MIKEKQAEELRSSWILSSRWKGIYRPYSSEDVVKLRGSVKIEYTLAKLGAEKLWKMLRAEPIVTSFSTLTGTQAIEEITAGLKSIFCTCRQIESNNTGGEIYSSHTLNPTEGILSLVNKINNSLLRADQRDWYEGKNEIEWLVPIVADAETGYGGNLNTYKLMRRLIEAGAAAVLLEDQLPLYEKFSSNGGKILVPTQEAINRIVAARLASDILDVPILIIAGTDACSASSITNDIDPRDTEFFTGSRTSEGFYKVKTSLGQAISRGLAFAPYADLIYYETSKPDLVEAKEFADIIRLKFPGKLLAYNHSPSFNWKQNLDEETMLAFNENLAEIGYKYQFVTLAGWNIQNADMYKLVEDYIKNGVLAYSQFREKELTAEKENCKGIKDWSFAGKEYYNAVHNTITRNHNSAGINYSIKSQQFITRLVGT